MSVMNELIKTTRDVDLLIEKVNWLGNSTAASYFI